LKVVLINSLPHGVILLANKESEDAKGHAKDEFIGRLDERVKYKDVERTEKQIIVAY
jgi:hypothetical protein